MHIGNGIMVGSNENNVANICTISTKNIFAFSIANKVGDNSAGESLSSYVYVSDITSPWQVFKVCSKKLLITVLEWNTLGELLLIGDMEGNIEIWKQKNSIDEWIQVYTVYFSGEEILNCKFFHNGRSLALNYDRKETVIYVDKFFKHKFCPTVRLFGGTAAEGCLVVLSSGLLGAFVISQLCSDAQNSNSLKELHPVTHSVGLTRHFISSVSIAYGQNGTSGNFRVSFAIDSSDKIMIKNFIVRIKRSDSNNIFIMSRSLPSFFLNEEPLKAKVTNIKIKHLAIQTDIAESLIVVKSKKTSSYVELWTLMRQNTPVNKFFQVSKTETFQSTCWKITASQQFEDDITSICVSKTHFDNTCVYLGMRDNSIQMLEVNFKLISSPILISKLGEKEMGCKQTKSPGTLTTFDVSFMGHLLIAPDSAKEIHIFKLPQAYQEQSSNQMALILYQTCYLEYSFLFGYDASDIFVFLPNSVLDAIIDKITDNFSRQASYVRQYNYANFLTMKANLFRKQSKREDLNNLLLLNSVLTTFKSLLRPTELSSLDKGPVESLAIVLTESVLDIDKVIFNLDAAEFTVEPATLQGLLPLVQWVGDLALNILSKIPQNLVQKNVISAYDISKDIIAINSIRELLVIIRIWGLLNSHCLPIFLKSIENIDILAVIFRLLTRLSINVTDPDEVLLDECCILPTQVLIPELEYYTTHITMSFQNVSSGSFMLDVIPKSVLNDWNKNTASYAINIVDSVRHLKLGKKVFVTKQCLRCGLYNNILSIARTVAMRAWEDRWRNCRCGGNWKITKRNWKNKKSYI